MKKFGRKQAVIGMLSAAMMFGSASTALAAQGWQQNQTGWWYENSDGSYVTSGWKEIGGVWYYFDASGYMATGWVQDGGRWYFNNADGAMQTGWINVNNEYYYLNPVSDGTKGAMVTGEAIIDGVSYFFNESGACTNIFSLTIEVPRYNADGSVYNQDDYPKREGSGLGGSANASTLVEETNETVIQGANSAVEAAKQAGHIGPDTAIKSVSVPSVTDTHSMTFNITLNPDKKADATIADVSDVLLIPAQEIIAKGNVTKIEYNGGTLMFTDMQQALNALETASQSAKPLDQLKTSYTVKLTLTNKETVTYTFNLK